MVRKTIIAIIISFLLYACSNEKKAFFREKEVLKVLEEINQGDYDPFVFLIIRTTRCDLCTEAAKEIFKESQSKMVLLIDAHDSSFIQSNHSKNKIVIAQPNSFFESRGIDFGENYMFIVQDNKVKTYHAVNKETKSAIKELINHEFN